MFVILAVQPFCYCVFQALLHITDTAAYTNVTVYSRHCCILQTRAVRTIPIFIKDTTLPRAQWKRGLGVRVGLSLPALSRGVGASRPAPEVPAHREALQAAPWGLSTSLATWLSPLSSPLPSPEVSSGAGVPALASVCGQPLP